MLQYPILYQQFTVNTTMYNMITLVQHFHQRVPSCEFTNSGSKNNRARRENTIRGSNSLSTCSVLTILDIVEMDSLIFQVLYLTISL